VLESCLACCEHLCASPLSVAAGFGGRPVAEALLHIAHFVADPCAPLALKIIAALFDHSVAVIQNFEEFEFTHHLWKLFKRTRDSNVKALIVRILNRWIVIPPGNRHVYRVYLENMRGANGYVQDEIAEGVFWFVSASRADAEYAADTNGLMFCANRISYGLPKSHHFGMQTAVLFLQLDLPEKLIDAFVEDIARPQGGPWRLIRNRSAEVCRDVVDLVLALHRRFPGFGKYLLEGRESTSLMSQLAAWMRNGRLTMKVILFELVIFWLACEEPQFILAFFDLYGVADFLGDFEEFEPGQMRDAIFSAIMQAFERAGPVKEALLDGGLAATLERLMEDDYCGEKVQAAWRTLAM
jgi:hypothetical protein